MAAIEDSIDLDFTEEEDKDKNEDMACAPVSLDRALITNPSVLDSEDVGEGGGRGGNDAVHGHAPIRFPSPERDRGAPSDSFGGFRAPPIRRRRYPYQPYGRDALSASFQKRSASQERKILRAKRFGISPPPEDLTITEDELADLYESMGINEDSQADVRLYSVFVCGLDNLSSFHIEKMFAEFSPSAVEMVDETSCNVIWNNRFVVGKMMLEMTKPLKRIRGRRESEEGEVAEGSGEEEGEMVEEHGDDVTIFSPKGGRGNSEARKESKDFIEVDVDHVNIPPGKWRVLTRHVERNRLIILRFSTREDLAKGRAGPSENRRLISTGSSVDTDGYSYKWTTKSSRVRPGLNIFNEKGDELEWDYEHDTRFYTNNEEEKRDGKETEKEKAEEGGEEIPVERELLVGNVKVKSRGRGANKVLNVADILHGRGSMAADEEEVSRAKSRSKGEGMRSHFEDDDEEDGDSDWSDDRDPSPTPQPWDIKRRNVRISYHRD